MLTLYNFSHFRSVPLIFSTMNVQIIKLTVDLLEMLSLPIRMILAISRISPGELRLYGNEMQAVEMSSLKKKRPQFQVALWT